MTCVPNLALKDSGSPTDNNPTALGKTRVTKPRWDSARIRCGNHGNAPMTWSYVVRYLGTHCKRTQLPVHRHFQPQFWNLPTLQYYHCNKISDSFPWQFNAVFLKKQGKLSSSLRNLGEAGNHTLELPTPQKGREMGRGCLAPPCPWPQVHWGSSYGFQPPGSQPLGLQPPGSQPPRLQSSGFQHASSFFPLGFIHFAM